MTTLEPEFVSKDERRSLTQLLTADIKQVNVYEAKEGSVLGNHYHKQTTEYFYILEGKVGYNKATVLGKGSLFSVRPLENHTITCLSDVQMMTFLTVPFDKENPDLWKE